MSPHQKIFDLVREKCKGTVTTYDTLIPSNPNYPFMYVGEQIANRIKISKRQFGYEVIQTVHVYHNQPSRRGYVSSLVDSFVLACQATGNGAITLENVTIDYFTDDSGTVDLLHGVVELTYHIY